MLFKCSKCSYHVDIEVSYFEDEKLCPYCKTHTLMRPDMQERRDDLLKAYASKARLPTV